MADWWWRCAQSNTSKQKWSISRCRRRVDASESAVLFVKLYTRRLLTCLESEQQRRRRRCVLETKLARGERSIVLASVSKSSASLSETRLEGSELKMRLLARWCCRPWRLNKRWAHISPGWATVSRRRGSECLCVRVCGLNTATHCSPPPSLLWLSPCPYSSSPIPSTSSTNPTNTLTASFMHSCIHALGRIH